MQRRGVELVLDALEVIEPLDRAIELGALLFSELGFHAGNLFGESGPIEILYRGSDIGQHGETLVRYFRKTAEHDDLLLGAPRRQGQDSRPNRGHDRRMSGQYAEITLDAGNVDLIDFTGEGKFFG